MKATSNLGVLINGLIKENPTFVLMLGMCPTLGTTTSAENALGMGLATAFVLICSNMAIAAIKNIVPDKVRIPVFIVVIAAFVSIVELLMQAYMPALYKSLGIYIPLIVVNCIILGRAEAFAAKNSVVKSAFDGIGIGLGFTASLTVIGLVREFIGSGRFFGVQVYPDTFGTMIFVLAPGAFIVLSYLLLLFNRLIRK
ncbi:MAG: electron transport complex subunit E [Bacteroidia bacterium]|jgi:electron transport complex, rnfABCDGE type, E subunit|nr:electron transport complex subunit E [Bacteroidia bacterium]